MSSFDASAFAIARRAHLGSNLQASDKPQKPAMRWTTFTSRCGWGRERLLRRRGSSRWQAVAECYGGRGVLMRERG